MKEKTKHEEQYLHISKDAFIYILCILLIITSLIINLYNYSFDTVMYVFDYFQYLFNILTSCIPLLIKFIYDDMKRRFN